MASARARELRCYGWTLGLAVLLALPIHASWIVGLPVAIWMLHGFMARLPVELDEFMFIGSEYYRPLLTLSIMTWVLAMARNAVIDHHRRLDAHGAARRQTAPVEEMADVLAASHGLQLTDREEEADVILINTCSIREKAQEKVFSQLGRWKNWKNDKPDLVIGVGGCVASQEGSGIIERAPIVDMVFGPQTLHRLPNMLDRVRGTGSAVVVKVGMPFWPAEPVPYEVDDACP